MQTAACETSSSASARSSSSNGSSRSDRQNRATPSSTPRAFNGTRTSECTPWASTRSAPSGSCSRHARASASRGSTPGSPLLSVPASGVAGTTSTTVPTG